MKLIYTVLFEGLAKTRQKRKRGHLNFSSAAEANAAYMEVVSSFIRSKLYADRVMTMNV